MFASNTSQVSGDAVFVEDVFQNWLYTGNGSTQTITNGIDLSGEGGLVWTKARAGSGGTSSHWLIDTVRGANSGLNSNGTSGSQDVSVFNLAFGSSGYSLNNSTYATNDSGTTYASWTFRKQPKFFDVVTYTGNFATTGAGQTINHNLGSTPGCIIVKNTSGVGNWRVYHLGTSATPNYDYLSLNQTAAKGTSGSDLWQVTSTSFYASDILDLNNTGATFVAYLFAHNAGGFGLTGTDNVISCGSYTTNGSGVITSPVNLGYEPQWILSKRVDSTGNWRMLDVMRGDGSADGNISNQYYLYSNLSDAESGPTYGEPAPTATGFTVTASTASSTYIYIAIRRGPMKTPTSGTSVFAPISSANSTGTKQTTSFPVDVQWLRYPQAGYNNFAIDRLRGVGTSTSAFATPYLVTNTTDAEATLSSLSYQWDNTGFGTPSAFGGLQSIYWNFRRAPGFFDEVCWTGDDAAPRNINHNLTVAPEMMIVKNRTMSGTYWIVYHKDLPSALYFLSVNTTDAQSTGTNVWRSTAPTSTVFTVGNDSWVNSAGNNYVNYLFASCPGVSKVGSYTGTGTTQQINCGFTGGARFVLIKRKDSTGGWYVWDTARGIVSGNDPYLLLNSTAAEVTTTDYIDPVSSGFEISSTAPAAINASGGTFIYLAIA